MTERGYSLGWSLVLSRSRFLGFPLVMSTRSLLGGAETITAAARASCLAQ